MQYDAIGIQVFHPLSLPRFSLPEQTDGSKCESVYDERLKNPVSLHEYVDG